MSRLLPNCLALRFILAISLLAITKTHLANQATLKLMVRVYNYARVSETILAQAEKEASRIFREIGVQILWLQCPLSGIEEQLVTGCQSESDSTSLILRIIPRFTAAAAGLRNEALGFALPSQEGGIYASIFYHPVEETAQSGPASRSQILGHAIAHEIGHLLLGSNSHSSTGMMRAQWSRDDLQRATLELFEVHARTSRINSV